eukprot:4385537-Prymnesium_polylepis.1
MIGVKCGRSRRLNIFTRSSSARALSDISYPGTENSRSSSVCIVRKKPLVSLTERRRRRRLAHLQRVHDHGHGPRHREVGGARVLGLAVR